MREKGRIIKVGTCTRIGKCVTIKDWVFDDVNGDGWKPDRAAWATWTSHAGYSADELCEIATRRSEFDNPAFNPFMTARYGMVYLPMVGEVNAFTGTRCFLDEKTKKYFAARVWRDDRASACIGPFNSRQEAIASCPRIRDDSSNEDSVP